jgi:tetratricopeptide (TPR) repeat protein
MSTPNNDRLSQLRNLLECDSHDAFCMYGMGMEYANAGSYQEAIAWFDRTIETDPAYCYAWFHKAKSQDNLGNQAGAIQTLEHGIAQARTQGDNHAAEEMGGFLQSIL